ncbi:hypothetical protein GZ77_04730 [Endozoicomonas montiporae]|uniref:Uncharacterized protein n=2 Tax=Endozoicomonas montiporae TaxID=1027273 RepID=A0A081NBK6_9GAMM|nr:hypothetical protein [Endozoicomonas montiporae]AMO56119.1 hypothetical protein EZMO1_1996 [Endozoicomonas montiporae CL-33]KEQ15829.1 hypothetical protein GZ77_04730 [Endozoicomonas montiporae]
MATTNIWQQFKALIPQGARTVVMITGNNGNGTSTAVLRDGTAVVVKGESVGAGKKAFVQDGEIKGAAPELGHYEAEV